MIEAGYKTERISRWLIAGLLAFIGLLIIHSSTAAAALYDEAGVAVPYTFSDNKCTHRVDPINVVWEEESGGLNAKPVTTNRIAEAIKNNDWPRDDYQSMVFKATKALNAGDIGYQWMIRGDGTCVRDSRQMTDGSPAGSRNHVRLFQTSYGSKLFVVGDAHRDQKHQQDINDQFDHCETVDTKIAGKYGHVATSFNSAREKMKEDWPGSRALKNWGNTQTMVQCNGQLTWSDGRVLYLGQLGSFNLPNHSAGVTYYSNVSEPTISGTPKPGNTLTVSAGTWEPTATSLNYQWCLGDLDADTCTPISGATGSSWSPSTSYVGKFVSAYVQPTTGVSDSELSPPVRIMAIPPNVATDTASDVTSTSVKLLGWLNPNGDATNFYFQYGKTTTYESNVPVAPGWSAGSGTSAFRAAYDLSGLEPLTTYHYRLVAANSAGTTIGSDQTFTTTALPAPDAVTSAGQPYVYFGLPSGTMKGQMRELRFNGTAWVASGYGYANAVAGTPSAIAAGDGSRYVYYRGTDGALRLWWISGNNWNNTQWGYANAMGSDPSAVKTPDGSHYIYYRGTDGTMRAWWINGNNYYDTGYGYANAVAGTPSAVAASDGSRYVYYRGTDNALHGWWINGNNWNEVQWGADGAMGGDPTTVMSSDGTRYVYFRGSNGSMRQWTFKGNSGTETAYGYANAVLGTPSAVVTSDGSRYVYYRGADGAMHGWWINGNNWNETPWGYANVMGSDPGAVLGSGDVREAFYMPRSGGVFRWWFQGNAWNGAAIGS